MGQKRHHGYLLRWLRLTPSALAVGFAGVVTGGLYLWHLGRFIGQGPAEAQAAATYGSLGNLLANPINLPYKFLDFVSLQLPFGSLAMRGRLTSALLALACALIFYLLARRWHGARNAIMATLLFVPSGWMLATGRHGSGLIMLTTMVLGLVYLASWVNNAENSGRLTVWYAAAVAAALTVPGGLWFVIAVSLIVLPKLRSSITRTSRWQLALGSGLLLAALALVGTAIARQPELLWQWLGLPADWPDMVIIATQAAGAAGFLLARGPFMPEIWLAHTPLLDAATAALFILGTVFYIQHHGNARVRLLLAFSAIGVILIALQGTAALAYLVPVAYLVAATGIAYILHSWQNVFPRNPFARGLAFCLIAVMTVSVAGYHTQRYFIAWRNSPDTITEYRSTEGNLKASNLIQ